MAGVFTHNGNIVEGLPSTANMINYDNTSSGMQATQLQAAVDELNTNKQSKTDNSLTTTDKTITGGINELKSGLTNLDNEVNGDAVEYPYADVITIPDAIPANVADCSVKIEPVQDLHGQSAPYVGGAGKNKFDVSEVNATNWTISNETISNKITDTRTKLLFSVQIMKDSSLVDVLVNTEIKTTGQVAAAFTVPSVDFNKIRVKHNGNVRDIEIEVFPWTKTGNFVISFNLESNDPTTVDGIVISNIQLEEGSTPTTFAPYTNYCPITGHTESVVTRTGKNWFDIDKYATLSAYFDAGTNKITSSGNDRSVICKVLPNTKFVVSITRTAINSQKDDIIVSAHENMPDINGTGTLLVLQEIGTNRRYFTVTTTSTTNYLLIKIANITKTDYQATLQTLQVELGETMTPYVKGDNSDYTIALGDTIYGGAVDFDSGVMTVDRAVVEFDGSIDENWIYEYHASADNFYISLQDANPTTSRDEIISNMFTASYSTMWVSSAHNLNVKPNIGISNVNDWKTWLSSNPLQVCYELATPTTIQLTPQQIQLLKGQNTLTASTGDISVTVNGVSGAIGAVQEQVNDHEERIGVVESGLTNVDVALSAPANSGKNLIPMKDANIKAANTSGTWDGDNYTLNGITMAIQKDTNGSVIGLKFTGTSSSQSSTYFYAGNFTCKKGIEYRMNGCPAGGGGNTYLISISGSYPDTGNGSVIIPFNIDTLISVRISVAAGYAFAADGVVFTPMIRYSWVDDSTFVPYIPSVDARLDAVESGLDTVKSGLIKSLTTQTTITTDSNGNGESATIASLHPNKTILGVIVGYNYQSNYGGHHAVNIGYYPPNDTILIANDALTEVEISVFYTLLYRD